MTSTSLPQLRKDADPVVRANALAVREAAVAHNVATVLNPEFWAGGDILASVTKLFSVVVNADNAERSVLEGKPLK